jgi:hypothetical protein
MDNIAYGSKNELANINLADCEHSGNWFDQTRKFTDTDFITLDESSLTAPRKANGDLPDVGFMKLKRP